jgi:hypothetical protein
MLVGKFVIGSDEFPPSGHIKDDAVHDVVMLAAAFGD